jgi:methylmalonyl-CoA mutase cobalamin-binding subunit
MSTSGRLATHTQTFLREEGIPELLIGVCEHILNALGKVTVTGLLQTIMMFEAQSRENATMMIGLSVKREGLARTTQGKGRDMETPEPGDVITVLGSKIQHDQTSEVRSALAGAGMARAFSLSSKPTPFCSPLPGSKLLSCVA